MIRITSTTTARHHPKSEHKKDGRMASDVIDFVLQMLVERDILQGIPSWELLKDYLARECMMAPERLETRRGEIVEKYIRCKHEQLEKATHDLMGMTSNMASTDKASINQVIPNSTGLEERPNESKGIGSKGEEELIEPTIRKLRVSNCLNSTLERRKYSSFASQTDATQSKDLQSESACFMSICLPNGKWGGAALKYWEKEESYISRKIIDRHKLEKETSEYGKYRRIRLTWRLCGEEETNVTQFTVHESLPCDFMLGTRHLDEDFNRADSSEDDADADSTSSTFLMLACSYLANHEVSGTSKNSEPTKSPLPQMYSLPGQTSPNPSEYAKLVGLANAESIAALMREMAISKSGSQTPQQGRQPAEEIQSAPSQVNNSRRPRQPKKGPPKAKSVEQHSAKRHNAR